MPAKLEAEKQKVGQLEVDLEALKTALQKEKDNRRNVAKAAIIKFQQSDYYNDAMKDRYNGGQTAAHRCVVHALKVKKDQWTKVEDAYVDEESHLKPTGFETQTFTDMVIQNADPREYVDYNVPQSAYWDPADQTGLTVLAVITSVFLWFFKCGSYLLTLSSIFVIWRDFIKSCVKLFSACIL